MYLDRAALAEDDSHAVHVDHHGSDVGDFGIAASVLILSVHSEVWQVGGAVAEFGQGVGAGSHVVVGAFVKRGVVRVTRNRANALF